MFTECDHIYIENKTHINTIVKHTNEKNWNKKIMAQQTLHSPDLQNIEAGNQNGNQQRHETIPLHRMGSSISQQERAEAAERRRMRQIFNMVSEW